MRVGVHLANWGAPASVERITGLARAAEDLGFDSVWVTDHVVIPDRFDSVYPIRPMVHTPDTAEMCFEPIVTLAAVAGATTRVGIGTSALITPARNPLVTVKQLTTLDVLSGGRLEVGLGAGWLEEEFDALGASFADRGALLDEHIEIFRRHWADERPEYRGRLTEVPRLRFQPRPVRPGGPPVTIGGQGPAAFRRAAQTDGWQPVNLLPADLVGPVDEIRRRRKDLGRPEEFEVLLRCPVEMGDDIEPDPARPLVGPASLVREGIRRYAEVGVTGLLISAALGKTLDAGLATLERFAAGILPDLDR